MNAVTETVPAKPAGTQQAAARPRRSYRTVVALGVAVAIAAGGAGYILMPKDSETTDNAYLQADSTAVAPRVRGFVAEVLVRHNQEVRAGELLARIDPEEFAARAAGARAELQNARAAVASVRAALLSQDADERLAAANIRAAETAIAAADAQRERATADRRRYDHLVVGGAVSQRDVDQSRAAAIGAESEAERSRAMLDVSRSQSAVTAARRPGLEAALAQAEAQVRRMQATLDLAEQDLRHTEIRAPVDGVVGDRQVQQGDYVQAGTRLLTLVPLDRLYVTANFKETQIARMEAGQPATVAVDALPGTALHGHVESFAPGSGSSFSLLPFEPGTGNFTKIVQRVPVRIRLDADQAAVAAHLRPGLSVTVTVNTASHRR